MFDQYREIVVCDFEFHAAPGERPDVGCLVAKLLKSGRTIRLWRDEMGPEPPYPTDDDTLFVAYYASAELGCHKVLGWPMPRRILDPYVEFRNLTNGLEKPSGSGLIGALIYFGLDTIGASAKDDGRSIFIRGGPYSEKERQEGLDYCQTDVEALERLLIAMAPRIDLPRALLRGRYMAAAASMEHAGTPIDVDLLGRLRERWTGIQDVLIADVDVGCGYHVYDGRMFKLDRFEQYLIRAGIPWWSHTDTGRLSTSDDAFRLAAKVYPQIAPLRELRHAVSDMRLNDLSVGHDGRNRTILSAFASKTGRNQPSSTHYIFGPSVWLRGLVKPPPGHGIAYIDYSQQEFGIAAAKSGDQAMRGAYLSGDPYLAFAKLAGGVPPNATKQTHGPQRELFKLCALGVLYGMSAMGLSLRIDRPTPYARDLLRLHRETFLTFWRWSDAVVDYAMLYGHLDTVFGWRLHVDGSPVNTGAPRRRKSGPPPKLGTQPRTLRNFLMQSGGAEMLRLACCMATERGIEVCAPVHDAVLISAPLDRLDADVEATRACMAEASKIVLAGFEIGTDVNIVRYPDRYMDPRGEVMWERVMRLVDACGQSVAAKAA
jgi:DNA polymerase I